MFSTICRFTLSLLIISMILIQLGCHVADAKPQDISTIELHEMMASGEDFALINVLPKIIYDSTHLPESVNYPIGTLEQLSALPFPKNIPLVFYCMGHL